MRTLCLALAVLALSAGAASAQDPVQVDAKHYAVILENEHVRVLRIEYGPGETSIMHDHPDAVAIFMTDGAWRMSMPGGVVEDVPPGKTGDVLWTPATKHNPRNTGSARAVVILVELKTPKTP